MNSLQVCHLSSSLCIQLKKVHGYWCKFIFHLVKGQTQSPSLCETQSFYERRVRYDLFYDLDLINP